MNYYCSECGYQSDRMLYKCPICHSLNSYNSCMNFEDHNNCETEELSYKFSPNHTLINDFDNPQITILNDMLITMLNWENDRNSATSMEKGEHFERFLRILFEISGYKIIDTHNSDSPTDGGIDMIAIKDMTKFYIQAKYRHSLTTKVIDVNTVRSLSGAIQVSKQSSKSEDAFKNYYDKGVIITTHFFSFEAQKAAAKLNIELIDKPRLTYLILQLQPELFYKFYYNPKEDPFVKNLRFCPACGELYVRKANSNPNNTPFYWAHPEYKNANKKGCILTSSD